MVLIYIEYIIYIEIYLNKNLKKKAKFHYILYVQYNNDVFTNKFTNFYNF